MEKKERKLKLTRRRIIVLIIVAILLFLIIFGISKLISAIFSKEKAYGNLSNQGLATSDGSTVFYNKYDEGIVKVKGGKEYQITDETAYSITLYNGKLYYITISKVNTIDLMCVNTNGDDYKKIKTLNTRIDKFYIKDGYVYYAINKDGSTGIAKLSLENGEEVVITVADIRDFVLDKEKIYFTDNVGFLYSVGINGMDKKEISTDYNIEKIQLMKKWIYYYDSEENALCRIKTDGSSRTVVTSFVSNGMFNVTSKYIYYLDIINGKICRCDLKGKKSSEIVSTEITTTSINIVDGTMYYLDKRQDETQMYQMYRVKTNGKAAKEIVYE